MMAHNPKLEVDKEKRVYKKPVLTKLGNMAQVTKKSGGTPDMQQSTKPGGGGG